MNAVFTAALAVLALFAFGLRPADADPGTGRAEARTGRQMLAAARTARWGARLLGLVQVAELPLWVAYAAARTALYLAAVAVTWAACLVANALAMDDRPIRLIRLSRPEVVCA